MWDMNTPQTIIIKVGTSTLTDGTLKLSRSRMVEIIRQLAHLHQQHYRVVLVSSGAMAAGRELLGNPSLPTHLPVKQMLSAVGQGHLMQVYSMLFGLYDVKIGQVLLTHADLAHRTRYLNARHTLETLLDYGIVPVINENDTVAVEEIKVGDNDNLSAQIAALLDADWLILLTDQTGLYDADPRVNTDARLIHEVFEVDDRIWSLAGGAGTGLGTGGMITKVQAAQLAMRSGTRTVIASGTMPEVVLRILAGEAVGTVFVPSVTHLESRKRWLLAERSQGSLVVDAGAARVIRDNGASLLPVGIQAVEGDFERGAVIGILDEQMCELAKGLTNYSSHELSQISGYHSGKIVKILGYGYGKEAIHRDHMVVLTEER